MLNSIINIGIDPSLDSKHDIKLRKLFNGLTFFGFFSALIQIAFVIQVDFYASLFHSIWGVYCFVALYLHHLGYFRFAKVSLVTVVLVFGILASARIGSEYYPHIASFGIMGAAFVFFDVRKEWGFLVFFILLHASGMILVESDIYQNTSISFPHPELLKTFTLIGTSLFVSLEILTILRLSWLTEKEFISELRSSNKELRQINDEKNVMLQEIHHRVKNNLQMVISLIRLQSNKIEDEKTVAIFKELKMRLISIARMHEMMYLSEKSTRSISSNMYRSCVI